LLREGDVLQTKQVNNAKALSRRLLTSAYEWISTLIVSLLLLVVLFTFFFRVVTVTGDSMDNTLHDGERLLLVTNVSEYNHGDIVVVDRYTIEPLIKRVIAVGGDTIEIKKDGTVYLNGSLLSEPYASHVTPMKDCTAPITIPKGYVFVMGDNRMNSLDSRSETVGLVLEKDIIGKAILRVSPFSAFGSVYNNMEHTVVE
jgi:signal peptidase I